MDDRVSQFLLELYRASREIPFRNFQGWCLARLQQVIDFDSAWWGNASEMPLQMHRIHLHNCAPSILEDYLPYIDGDLFRIRACAQPGVTLNTSDIYTREALDETPIHQGFAIKHKVAWAMGTVVIDEISSLNELMTLWRHDRARPFTEAERVRKQTLMPHMVEAHRNARLLELRQRSTATESQIWALCDERGYLQELSSRFASIAQRVWPHWRGSLLPGPLADACVLEVRIFHWSAFDLAQDRVLPLVEHRRLAAKSGFLFPQQRLLQCKHALRPLQWSTRRHQSMVSRRSAEYLPAQPLRALVIRSFSTRCVATGGPAPARQAYMDAPIE